MIGLNIRQAARATVNRVNQLLATSSTNFSLQTAGMSLESEQYPPIEATMRKALKTELKPVFMEVINESPMHNTPKHAESHFRVFVVSDKFNDLTLIKRHRLVNDTIKKALQAAGFEFMHALSIETKTPKQWEPEQEPEKSPPCLGGFGK